MKTCITRYNQHLSSVTLVIFSLILSYITKFHHVISEHVHEIILLTVIPNLIITLNITSKNIFRRIFYRALTQQFNIISFKISSYLRTFPSKIVKYSAENACGNTRAFPPMIKGCLSFVTEFTTVLKPS